MDSLVVLSLSLCGFVSVQSVSEVFFSFLQHLFTLRLRKSEEFPLSLREQAISEEALSLLEPWPDTQRPTCTVLSKQVFMRVVMDET